MALMLTLTLSRRAPLFTEMQRLLRESDADSLAVLGIVVPIILRAVLRRRAAARTSVTV